MDEKGAQSNMPCSRTSPRRRPLLAVILLVGIVYNFWYWSASLFPTPRPLSSSAAGSPKDAHPTAVVAIKHDSDAGRVLTKGLVPLEAHIISKCPDTRVWNNSKQEEPRKDGDSICAYPIEVLTSVLGCLEDVDPPRHAARLRQGRL